MKLSLIGASLLFLGLSLATARAEVVQREVTETSVVGTVSEVNPDQTIVIRSDAGIPKSYTINRQTVFVDEGGSVVTYEALRGKPVKVYVTESTEQPVVVEKIVVTKPVVVTKPPAVAKRTETRTETHVED